MSRDTVVGTGKKSSCTLFPNIVHGPQPRNSDSKEAYEEISLEFVQGGTIGDDVIDGELESAELDAAHLDDSEL